ncbi:MAG: cellulose binding domain-containing protein [Streptosporangiaceae bacterium]|nr:cellulose binding domain-containing protein [Streptosporangiaceae bacterium]MBV9855973.1 cellulose binding domain-containing protein [Streptosporangiaceae bacterium]
MTSPPRRLRSAALVVTLTAAATAAAISTGATRAPADTGAACAANYTIAWQTPSNTPSTSSPSPSPTPIPSTASPSTSPAPTPASPTPTPTPTAAGCQVSWSVTNSWPGGFQLGFTVTNSGKAATKGWNVIYSWPGTQAISQIWSATATQSGAAVTVTSAGYDGAIAAGGTATFGLLGTGAAPASLTGPRCTAR